MKDLILRWLIKQTHFSAVTLYTMLDKCSIGEIETYLKGRNEKL